MKQKTILFTVVLLAFVFFVTAYLIIQNSESNNRQVGLCDKETNCCEVDKDCQYIWNTGGCNTPEYVAARQKEAEENGITLGEAPPRKNVTCTCEMNRCVTND